MSVQENIASRQASVVDVVVSEGSALVTPTGELDISNAGELREQLAVPRYLPHARCASISTWSAS